MNKLAAGALALALALGLGAVAPAVAAESRYSGQALSLERYDERLDVANAKYKAFLAAELKLENAKKELDAAEAARKAAADAYFAYFPEAKLSYNEAGTLESLKRIERRPVEEAAGALNLVSVTEFSAAKDIENYQDLGFKPEKIRSIVENYAVKKAGYTNEQFNTAINRYVNAIVEYRLKLKAYGDKTQAYENLKAAELTKTAKDTAYRTAKKAYDDAKKEYEDAVKDLEGWARIYGYAVQTGANGVQIVKPEDARVKKAQKEFNLSQLAAAREKALTTIEAVNLLKKLAPKKIAGKEAAINKLVSECEALVKLADKYLAKKSAFVATAYADEEKELSAEEVTKQLNEKSDKLQDMISDDKKEEAPAKEEKEEAPEKEEKEEAPAKEKENKPAREAGANARTGIAGIAGVAGILAAASVAYAASKRD